MFWALSNNNAIGNDHTFPLYRNITSLRVN